MLGVAVVVVDVVVVVVQAVVLLVLMVVVEFVVSRLPRPLSDNLVEQITEGLGILMGVGGVRMELGIVVMLVDVVVSVFIDLHITWVEFMLVLELFVTLVLLLGGFILVAFFILIIALLLAKASLFSSSFLAKATLFSSSILAINSFW